MLHLQQKTLVVAIVIMSTRKTIQMVPVLTCCLLQHRLLVLHLNGANTNQHMHVKGKIVPDRSWVMERKLTLLFRRLVVNVAGKTLSSQILNGTNENTFFVSTMSDLTLAK